jgi:hypothetical protein
MANKLWNGTLGTTAGDFSDAANFTPSGLPGTGDNLRFTGQYTQSVTSNVGVLSGVTLGNVVVERGFAGAFGDSTNDVMLRGSRFEYSGSTSAAFIDVLVTPSVFIYNTGSASSTGLRALYLVGAGISQFIMVRGSVGLAAMHGQSSVASSVRVAGGSLTIGNGVTLTTLQNKGGTVDVHSAATTITQYSGTVTLKESGAITTLNCAGGLITDGSTGTVTTANVTDGQLVVSYGIAKTITTLNQDAGSVSYDPNNVTISTYNLATNNRPATVSVSEA